MGDSKADVHVRPSFLMWPWGVLPRETSAATTCALKDDEFLGELIQFQIFNPEICCRSKSRFFFMSFTDQGVIHLISRDKYSEESIFFLGVSLIADRKVNHPVYPEGDDKAITHSCTLPLLTTRKLDNPQIFTLIRIRRTAVAALRNLRQMTTLVS